MSKNPGQMPAGGRGHRKQSIIPIDNPTIDQAYPQEITVCLWSKTSLSPWHRPGHAALLVRRDNITDVRRMKENRQNTVGYISFYPAEVGSTFNPSYLDDMTSLRQSDTEENLRNRVYTPRNNQVVLRHVPHGSDQELEHFGINADNFVSIHASGGAYLGLDMRRIMNFKSEIDRGRVVYELVSKENNCASIVWRALEAGGGDAFCEFQNGMGVPWCLWYRSVDNVKTYSERIKHGAELANQALNYIAQQAYTRSNRREQFQGAARIGLLRIGNDLYTYDDWRRESDVELIRGWNLRGIDKGLQNYWSYNWNDNYPEKLSALLYTLFYLREEFLVRKVGGPLDAALTALAMQFPAVVGFLKEESSKAWADENEQFIVNQNRRIRDYFGYSSDEED